MHYNLGIHAKKLEEKKEEPKLVTEMTQASLLQQSQPVAAKKLFDLCPSCGEASLAHEEGCKKCYGCGYSEC